MSPRDWSRTRVELPSGTSPRRGALDPPTGPSATSVGDL